LSGCIIKGLMSAKSYIDSLLDEIELCK
jgi:hypothetical protein